MDMTQANSTSPSFEGPALRLAGVAQSASLTPCTPEQLEQLLEEARALLASLKIDKSRIEARLAEFGRNDPIAEVKGYSALDEAIASCQQAIQTLDQSLLDSSAAPST